MSCAGHICSWGAAAQAGVDLFEFGQWGRQVLAELLLSLLVGASLKALVTIMSAIIKG